MVDGNKNITGLVDENAVKVNSYEYSPFGKLSTNNETIEQPFKFSSEYYDSETGLIYYNYRYYDVNTGKWLKRDPIQEEGGYNLYAFVNNNPVNYFDNLGLCSLENSTNKDIYKADFDGESLESLAIKLGMKKENWQCIWPKCYSGKPRDYPNGIKKGDLFDASNLTATNGPQIWASLKSNKDGWLFQNSKNAANQKFLNNFTFYSAKQLIREIKMKSGQGSSPLRFLLVHGHSNSSSHDIFGYMGGGTYFTIDDLIKSATVAEGAQDYKHAKKKIGPPRCWFTKNAKVYASACSTGARTSKHHKSSFAEYFANRLLRSGAVAYGTKDTLWTHYSWGSVDFMRVDGSIKKAYSWSQYLNEKSFWNNFNGVL